MEHEAVEVMHWYDKHYKLILVIPAIMIVAALIYLSGFFAAHGDIILKDVSLTGGTTVTVFDAGVDLDVLQADLELKFEDVKVRGLTDFQTGAQQGFVLDTKADVADVRGAVEEFLGYQLTQENSSIEFTGAALSSGFYQQLRFAIGLAFVLMAIVVFLIFRSFVPSGAVVLSAFADIILTVATVNLLGMEMGTAGIIGFLMLIGYSVDTDILLTTRVLKRHEGTVNERIWESCKTGLTMTLTSMVAVGVALAVVWSVSDVLRQIFTVLLIGLGFDLIMTWLANAGILKWYASRRQHG
ncbi:preprotein translocase subunit SecF [Candidatus Pacearchaeota archaeon]|nr:preprotein translocase subunit SecF [Candidatus Pacearchaeota archaeon]